MRLKKIVRLDTETIEKMRRDKEFPFRKLRGELVNRIGCSRWPVYRAFQLGSKWNSSGESNEVTEKINKALAKVWEEFNDE